jgi:hypothetical protein
MYAYPMLNRRCSGLPRGELTMRHSIGGGILAAGLLLGGQATAAEPVDLQIVLAADVSHSITVEEFRLQRQGYAAALRHPAVLQAIAAEPHRAVAVSFVEWSGPDEQKVVLDWTVIRDAESAAAAADAILAAPRSFDATTAIGAALDFVRHRFEESDIAADRRAILVSGDGMSNTGPKVTEARDQVLGAGITIDGLAIINPLPGRGLKFHTHPENGLPAYYRDNVIGGPGARVAAIEQFEGCGDAIADMLAGEIEPRASTRLTVRSADPS